MMPQAHYNLADLYQKRGKLAKAVLHYRKAADLTPAEPRAHWALGLALERMGETGSAEAAYRYAVSLSGDFPQAFYNLAELLFREGRYGEAEVYYLRFLRVWRGEEAFSALARRQVAACRDRKEERGAP
jgi:Flp pilus assembly protein TadD